MAMTMLFAVGWVAWLVWQLTPHSVVTDLVYQSREERSPRRKRPPRSLRRRCGRLEFRTRRFVSRAGAFAATLEKVNVDMLRLATELTTPIPQRSSRTSSSRSGSKTRSGARRRSRSNPLLRATLPPRRARSTAREYSARNRAESEFRRAVNLVNQGRIAEGMDGFRRALEIDPGHEAARQTMVALLLEAKRVDEAAVSCRTASRSTREHRFRHAARAHHGREQRYLHGAFRAAKARRTAGPQPGLSRICRWLYQRLERHKEAIEQYQAALRLAPSAGVCGSAWGSRFRRSNEEGCTGGLHARQIGREPRSQSSRVRRATAQATPVAASAMQRRLSRGLR